MRRAQVWRQWLRVGVGAGLLAVVAWWVGVGPFVHALGRMRVGEVALALGVTAVVTVCCAARWRLVAAQLGVHLALPDAAARCYRSQFLNAVLPGGVLGDVHRGVTVGASTRQWGRGLRTVVWERTAGQVVQVGLTAVVALPLLVPLPVAMLGWCLLAGAGAGALLLRRPLARAAPTQTSDESGTGRWARAWRALAEDAHRLHRRRVIAGVVLTSVVVSAGHVTLFVVAAHVTGVQLPWTRVVPLALLVLLAAAVPANVAGWGPREAAAAWVFHSIGLAPAQGVSVAVLYGLLSTAAVLPGALLLLGGPGRRHRATAQSFPIT